MEDPEIPGYYINSFVKDIPHFRFDDHERDSDRIRIRVFSNKLYTVNISRTNSSEETFARIEEHDRSGNLLRTIDIVSDSDPEESIQEIKNFRKFVEDELPSLCG